jgi:hypothetical protein
MTDLPKISVQSQIHSSSLVVKIVVEVVVLRKVTSPNITKINAHDFSCLPRSK